MECQLTITSAWIFLQLSGMHIGGQVCVCDFFFFSFFGNAPGLSSPPTPSASLPTLLPLAPGKPAGPSRSDNVYICGRRSSWCRGVQVGVGAGCNDLLSSFGGVCHWQCRQLRPFRSLVLLLLPRPCRASRCSPSRQNAAQCPAQACLYFVRGGTLWGRAAVGVFFGWQLNNE